MRRLKYPARFFDDATRFALATRTLRGADGSSSEAHCKPSIV
jgi:hypothetical protein